MLSLHFPLVVFITLELLHTLCKLINQQCAILLIRKMLCSAWNITRSICSFLWRVLNRGNKSLLIHLLLFQGLAAVLVLFILLNNFVGATQTLCKPSSTSRCAKMTWKRTIIGFVEVSLFHQQIPSCCTASNLSPLRPKARGCPTGTCGRSSQWEHLSVCHSSVCLWLLGHRNLLGLGSLVMSHPITAQLGFRISVRWMWRGKGLGLLYCRSARIALRWSMQPSHISILNTTNTMINQYLSNSPEHPLEVFFHFLVIKNIFT